MIIRELTTKNIDSIYLVKEKIVNQISKFCSKVEIKNYDQGKKRIFWFFESKTSRRPILIFENNYEYENYFQIGFYDNSKFEEDIQKLSSIWPESRN